MTPIDILTIVGIVVLCIGMASALFWALPENVERYPDEKARISETSEEDPRDG